MYYAYTAELALVGIVLRSRFTTINANDHGMDSRVHLVKWLNSNYIARGTEKLRPGKRTKDCFELSPTSGQTFHVLL